MTSEIPADPERAINALINRSPILSTCADLEDHHVKRLVMDFAQDIHDYDAIAARYGLGDQAGLFKWLDDHPTVVAKIARMKALNDSASSVGERIQLKAAHALEDALSSIAATMTDPAVPVTQRIDATKVFGRLSGADTQAQAKQAQAGASGTSLVINFNLGGRKETLTATVLDSVPEITDGA